jgi:pSer/pThr/pTyr-binding forkhead associated (FHA) protein
MMLYIQVYFNGVLKEQVELRKELTTIGRSKDNDIQIDNPGVSAHHARIVQEGQFYFIEDTNSTNGTNVNGEPVSRKQLEYGDIISIFKHTLKFSPLALQVETGKPTDHDTNIADGGGTVDIDVSRLDELLEQQNPINGAYLLIHNKDGRQRKRPLTNPTFTIGKDPLSDLVIRGWFVPRSVASINRRVDGYYLVPGKRGQVQLNGSRVRNEIKLKDGDILSAPRIAIQVVVDQLEEPADRT